MAKLLHIFYHKEGTFSLLCQQVQYFTLSTYLSSHKIRFTNASMLFDAGVKAIDIQPLLGHSNLAMTQHYIGQRTTERDSTEMARILA